MWNKTVVEEGENGKRVDVKWWTRSDCEDKMKVGEDEEEELRDASKEIYWPAVGEDGFER